MVTAQDLRQVFNEIAEIHAPVGQKEKDDLAGVKGVPGFNDVHIEFALVDLAPRIQIYDFEAQLLLIFKNTCIKR